MAGYVIRRLLAAAVQACVVLVITFTLVRLTPGDPVTAYLSRVQSEASVSPEHIALIRRQLGLDRPVVVQFWLYARRVLRGDLGISYTQSEPVLRIVFSQLPYTVQLALAALLIEVAVGLPLGVVAATRRGTALDYLATTAATAAYSLPRFWIGMVLILVFAVRFGMFPVIGVGAEGDLVDIVHHLVLPAVALGLAGAAYIARMTRSAMLEVLGEDYVRTARAKGVAEAIVLRHHALRNALIPVVTVIGVSLGRALGGSAIIETLFGRVGIGSLLVEAITQRDYALVQGAILIFALGVFLVNLGIDIAYAWLNPRIRYT
ncbi:MAG: ABC transporter permease [Armatimonadota bacterium]|nr:ABC transporter permease [Armatimonadota bacterium]MDR7469599.1 ABC transporter permease [Armatimonadota bacterium]MDR7538319.1 ABC transporter permease [Armatimonadota bacterium]